MNPIYQTITLVKGSLPPVRRLHHPKIAHRGISQPSALVSSQPRHGLLDRSRQHGIDRCSVFLERHRAIDSAAIPDVLVFDVAGLHVVTHDLLDDLKL